MTLSTEDLNVDDFVRNFNLRYVRSPSKFDVLLGMFIWNEADAETEL